MDRNKSISYIAYSAINNIFIKKERHLAKLLGQLLINYSYDKNLAYKQIAKDLVQK